MTWGGIWTDMTIEQVLIRAIKTSGGLARGRVITESVVSRCVLGMPGCSEITQHWNILWRVMVPERNPVECRWCIWRMRSSDAQYEARKCDLSGRTEAKKEWCQIFQNWCLGGRGEFGGQWCQMLHWDRGKWRWWICQSQRRGEYCLKCEEWVFQWNVGGDKVAHFETFSGINYVRGNSV